MHDTVIISKKIARYSKNVFWEVLGVKIEWINLEKLSL